MGNLADLDIEYKYSSRRKSIGLLVTTEGKLVVSAPRGTPEAQLARVVNRHRNWIERKVTDRLEAWARLKEGAAFFLGQPYRLVAAENGLEPVALAGEEMQVRPGRDKSLWLPLRAWLQRQAEAHITARVAYYAPKMGVKARPAEMRDWKRRWGECHPKQGYLRFNWRLIMLPPGIIDYVVVHELAHLVAPGHNPRFWSVVAAILPDHQARRRWLNQYGTPFLLWQP